MTGNFKWCACELGAKMLRTRHRMLQRSALRAGSKGGNDGAIPSSEVVSHSQAARCWELAAYSLALWLFPL